MKNTSRKENLTRLALAFLIIIPAITAIIYLKSNAGEEPDNATNSTRTATKKGQIAVPDTTIAPEERPIVSAGEKIARPDSAKAERDLRSAAEAGAEDGYWDGYYDGAEGAGQNGRYDETGDFITATAREAYARNYREGYENGYKEAAGE